MEFLSDFLVEKEDGMQYALISLGMSRLRAFLQSVTCDG